MISIDDWLAFCERTIEGYGRVLDRLDDDQLNTKPQLDGANSAFQITTHAFAAAEWWCSHVILGNPSDRMRAEEFEAAGSGAQLRSARRRLVARLRELAPALDAATELAGAPVTTDDPLSVEWTVGTALIHVYEELTQHLGHLELTADLVGG